ncbi:MAG: DUF305 domain-containing protein [Actinomycetota bacterium]
MHAPRKILVIVAVLGSALTLSACSSTPNAATTGSSASVSSDFNTADVNFATNMAAHHQQAVDMSQMILDKSDIDPRVVTLAQEIKAAQLPEIKQMKTWLSDWGQKSSSMAGMDMGGSLMSDSDMAALKSSTGLEASKLFLTQMTVHHKGAITMATTEVDTGKNADAIAVAKKIIAAQTTEIATMSDILSTL